MASEISFIYNGDSGTLTVFVRGKTFVITKDNIRYHQIRKAVKAGDVDDLLKNIDEAEAIRQYGRDHTGRSRVDVRDGEVIYDGQPMHNVITERILQLMRADLPFEAMLKFLENLMDNPSKRSREELYRFLEHDNLPITDDGHFLGYKRVRANWKDIHSGKFDNSIGNILEMDRGKVDDDFRRDCSTGFHVGSLEYVQNFGTGGHMLIVKVNPRDVVSVPEADAKKLRCCRYEVLAEYVGALSESPLYHASTGSVKPVIKVDDDYEEDDDDQEIDNDECEYCGEPEDVCSCFDDDDE